MYPADQGNEPSRDLAEDEAIALLWREGTIPEWIDISVCDAVSGATIVELLVCGRFTANDALLYHQKPGRAPFHVVSPPLPPGHSEGQRFGLSDVRARGARAARRR